MGGKGPGAGQWQNGTTALTPEARQRVDDSQKAVFGMITQLRDSIPGADNKTPPAAATPAPSPEFGGATEMATPATPSSGGTVTPDTSTSTGGMLATAVTTPESEPAQGTKPKSKTIVTQT